MEPMLFATIGTSIVFVTLGTHIIGDAIAIIVAGVT